MTPSPVGTSTGSSPSNSGPPVPSESFGRGDTPEPAHGVAPSDVAVPSEVAVPPDVAVPEAVETGGAAHRVEVPTSEAGPASGPALAAGPPDPRPTPGPAGPSLFGVWLTAIAVLAGGIQVLFIHAMARRVSLPPVAAYDTIQAHYLVRGQWFIDPVKAAAAAHHFVPTAAHPPCPPWSWPSPTWPVPPARRRIWCSWPWCSWPR